MGFTVNWIAWVKATLTSSRASVLLNEVPTEEFDIQRGLRQGDPLSPFLFVLAMEGFHVGILEACRANVFQGASIGSSDIRISHLLYADDDAILLCDWRVQIARRILWMLRVFQLASGLKINLSKSKLIGIGVDLTEVQQIAEMIGFCVGRLPFTYLGVPVGCNMNHIDSWKPMIDKFNKKLSSWKAKLLSIGGRLTLQKSVMGSLAIYYMSIYKVPVTVLKMLESLRARFFWGADLGERKLHWIAWNRVVSARDSGGLGVGSLVAFNKALLFKWIWRFRNNVLSLRFMILIGKGVLGLPHGIGDKTLFWRDRWLGDRSLMEQFSRLFSLDPDPYAKVVERNSVEKLLAAFGREPRSGIPNSQWITLQDSLHAFSFSEAPDRMVWDLDESGIFSVSSMRSCLVSFLLDRRIHRTLVFFLPGFVSSLAQDRFWVGVTTPTEMTVKSLVTWADDIALDAGSKHIFDAVIMVAFWTIWSFRNKLLFGTSKPRKDNIFDDFRSVSYFWISNRRKKCKMSRDRWLYLPNMAFTTL
nr:RNA-directed DNA polymerase, eukaryota [Tanacetum cinerariifolium]